MTTRPLPTRRLLTSVDPSTGWHAVTVGVGQSGELVRVVADQRPYWLEPIWAGQRPRQTVTLRVERVSVPGGAVCTLAGFDVGWGFDVAPLGADGFVLTWGRAGPEEANLRVYSWDGVVVSAFHAGDGIEHVQTSARGDIWVSYFDEGVFGDGGFAGEGLICFTPTGDVRLRYSTVVATGGIPPIVDCYALNVASNDDVWCCYYTDFPLVHLRGGRLGEWWEHMPVHGASAFAVDARRVLFTGGYGRRDRVMLLSLGDMTTEELSVVDEEGEPLGYVSTVGRGSRMYFHQLDGGVHVAELDSFLG